MQTSKETGKKRQLSDSNISGTSKKQNLDTNVPSESILMDASVLQFQKRAMLIRLEEQKLEINSLCDKLKQEEERQSAYEEAFTMIQRFWRQLNESLRLTLGNLHSHMQVGATDVTFQFVESLFRCNRGSLNGDLENLLNQSVEETKRILSSVLGVVESKSNEIPQNKLKFEEFRDQHLKVCAEVDALKGKVVKLEHKLGSLRDQYEDAKERAITAHRKVSKLELRIMELQELNSQLSSNSNGSVPPSPIAKPERELVPEAREAKVGTPEMEDELAALKTIAESRLAEIEKLREERIEWIREKQAPKEKEPLSEEQITKSKPYLYLQQQHQFTLSEWENSKITLEKVTQEVTELTNTLQQTREEFYAAEEARRKEHEKQLKEVDATNARLRGERDALRKALDTKDANAPNPHIIDEFKLLLTTKDTEIQKLREQIEHLRQETHKWQTLKEEAKQQQDKLAESLDEKIAEINQLKALQTGGSINIANHESHELLKSERRISELEGSLEGVKQENEGLMGEIAAIEKEFNNLQEQNIRLLQQLTEKEKAVTLLMAEQIKGKQAQSLLQNEQTILKEKVSKGDERFAKQEELLQKLEGKNKLLQEQLKKSGEECKALSVVLEAHKRTARQSSQRAHELQQQLERLEKECQDQSKKATDASVSEEKVKGQLARLQEQLNAHARKLGSEDSSLASAQIAVLKSKLVCSVCNDREKSAIIARCFHQFCRECVQRNLDTRSRKCPACGKGFAESDVHSIWF